MFATVKKKEKEKRPTPKYNYLLVVYLSIQTKQSFVFWGFVWKLWDIAQYITHKTCWSKCQGHAHWSKVDPAVAGWQVDRGKSQSGVCRSERSHDWKARSRHKNLSTAFWNLFCSLTELAEEHDNSLMCFFFGRICQCLVEAELLKNLKNE